MENSISAITGLWKAEDIKPCADVNYAHINLGSGSTLVLYTEEAAMKLMESTMECLMRIRFRETTQKLKEQEFEAAKLTDLPS